LNLAVQLCPALLVTRISGINASPPKRATPVIVIDMAGDMKPCEYL
jgi:hypothetical protein